MKRFDRQLELDHETVGVLTLDRIENVGRFSDSEVCPLTKFNQCQHTVSVPTCICATGTTC